MNNTILTKGKTPQTDKEFILAVKYLIKNRPLKCQSCKCEYCPYRDFPVLYSEKHCFNCEWDQISTNCSITNIPKNILEYTYNKSVFDRAIANLQDKNINMPTYKQIFNEIAKLSTIKYLLKFRDSQRKPEWRV